MFKSFEFSGDRKNECICPGTNIAGATFGWNLALYCVMVSSFPLFSTTPDCVYFCTALPYKKKIFRLKNNAETF